MKPAARYNALGARDGSDPLVLRLEAPAGPGRGGGVNTMLGWFRSTRDCPIDAELKRWIEARMAWLVHQFGWERMLRAPVVLPDDEHFPDPYDGSCEQVRAMLDRVCTFMGVEPSRVMLDFFSDRGEVVLGHRLIGSRPGTAGLYQFIDGVTTVWVELSNLADPVSVVATLVHEVGHVLLLGEARIRPDAPDHEPLTDLISVFLGMGVMTSGGVIRSRNIHTGSGEQWSVSRQGYLDAPAFGYALALFAWLRGEGDPPWSRSLRPDVRAPFSRGLAYLRATGDSILSRTASLPDLHESEYALPARLEPSPLLSADDELAVGLDEGDEDLAGGDGHFARGVAHLLHGEFEQAVEELSAAIESNPADAEALHHRATAHVWLGQNEEALADAEEAVRLDPDDVDSYHARAAAHLACGHYDSAVADCDEVIRSQRRHADQTRLAEAYQRRGWARRALGDCREAVADFSRAIACQPLEAQSYAARAAGWLELGDLGRAQADAAKARSLGWPDEDLEERIGQAIDHARRMPPAD